MNSDVVIKESQGVLAVTLNRPTTKNSITIEMFDLLTGLFNKAAENHDVRAVLITGAGADFSSGGHLKIAGDFFSRPPSERAASVDELVSSAQTTMQALHRLPQPVVAAVRGHVIGAGMQIVLLADFVAASPSASFWLPNVGLAHNTDHGETYTLPRKVGFGRAMQIAVLGERIKAIDAERYGIANWIVAEDELDLKGTAVAQSLAKLPAVAVQAMKSLLRGPAATTLDAQLVAEREALRMCAATEDFAEANRAFGEKRPPIFRGC